MFPVETSNNFQGSCFSKNDSNKIRVLCTMTHCSLSENVIKLDRWYDCLAVDQAYELFQILPHLTGERDVVEVERQ